MLLLLLLHAGIIIFIAVPAIANLDQLKPSDDDEVRILICFDAELFRGNGDQAIAMVNCMQAVKAAIAIPVSVLWLASIATQLAHMKGALLPAI